MADTTPEKPTHTQPRPNLSTEHQPDGDARRPSDTLDRDRADGDPAEDKQDSATVKSI